MTPLLRPTRRWKFTPDRQQRRLLRDLADQTGTHGIALALVAVPQDAPLSAERYLEVLSNESARQRYREILRRKHRPRCLAYSIHLGPDVSYDAAALHHKHVCWRVFKTGDGPELREAQRYQELEQRLVHELLKVPTYGELAQVVRGAFRRSFERSDQVFRERGFQLLDRVPETLEPVLEGYRYRVLSRFVDVLDHIQDDQLLRMRSPSLGAPGTQERIHAVMQRYRSAVLLHVEHRGFALVAVSGRVAWSLSYPDASIAPLTRCFGVHYKQFARVLEDMTGMHEVDFPF
ncbi:MULTISPECIES: hypothetical protein [Bacteria]|uniref:hypothetical protein n=1 Tax=Pseudomonadati TaxID=3379134 RepID=UPI000223D0EB|nr:MULTISPECIES: hypothetical protein [Bacteria]AEN74741.1 hypothetical protein Rhom172_2862 [Rhodothermus marinus SG0.5JP17-172]